MYLGFQQANIVHCASRFNRKLNMNWIKLRKMCEKVLFIPKIVIESLCTAVLIDQVLFDVSSKIVLKEVFQIIYEIFISNILENYGELTDKTRSVTLVLLVPVYSQSLNFEFMNF
ncbi:hypothetical protein RF11_05960 [Thelohanellus kitauei]|uniref:Uncharacterized protein n=1 Tax=Thelohanellus kitauei TaxID=669202 RepID=A0A0C2II10_THEKT|nr:hypothetical protein RF11_05960 [Thelohanellus kitauei]